MIFRDEKRRLFQALINNHIVESDFDSTTKYLRVAVPERVLAKWKKQFYSSLPIRALPDAPRLINHFTMGADPEYVMIGSSCNYIYASSLSLNTMEAFGCDLSGRQMELRVAPSRFVLNIVASILETLRWQIVKYPKTLSYTWKAIGFMDNDGCGGHVHFARKNKNRPQELKSLNSMSEYLTNFRFLPGAIDRIRGSRYGRGSDVRNTSYGYEYRTLSTWLNTPFSAYISMVAAKLAIYHDWSKMAKGTPSMALENLFSAYQYIDDDAAIALQAIRVRKSKLTFQEIYAMQDMRWSWGLIKVGDKIDSRQTGLNSNLFIPPIIEASHSTQEEIFQHLITDQPLSSVSKPCETWTPTKLQEDEYPLSVQPHEAGLSEVAQGLISKEIKVIVGTGNYGDKVEFRGLEKHYSLFKLFRSNLSKKGVDVQFSITGYLSNTIEICIPRNRGIQENRYIVPSSYVKKWRNVLLAFGLPIVEYTNYTSLRPFVVPKKKKRDGGKLLFKSA